MDSSQKEDSVSSGGPMEVENKKSCAICKTTKTPLWRSGPYGPKSLCNACGIRYRKKISCSLGLDRPNISDKKKENPTQTKTCGNRKGKTSRAKDVLKVNLMPLGKEVVCIQGQRLSMMRRQRSPRQWGEVERAALLLMAMSCGAVFA